LGRRADTLHQFRRTAAHSDPSGLITKPVFRAPIGAGYDFDSLFAR